MSKCSGNKNANIRPTDPCSASPASASGSCSSAPTSGPPKDAPTDALAWFGKMIENCLDYARAQQAAGRPIVGILCEYTPRELILAAGAVPVCLCGGSATTIPAAEEHLPSLLCPLIKSTYGYHLLKSNPFLEMAALVVAETTCDGKKKMYELMAESRPMYVLELPQKEDDRDAMEHWVREMRKLKRELETRFVVEITDEKLREAIAVMNHERALRRELASLMKSDTPPLTGRQLLELKSSISGIPADLEHYEEALKGLKTRQPVAGIASCVRVLLTGVPLVHGAERVLEIIEDHGGLAVGMENCTGLRPILDDVATDGGDPLLALAQKYYQIPCSVKTRNEARMESLRKLAAEYRAQCVIELVWQGCLTYAVESFRVKRLAEQTLGIPYLRIETDYSPSDSARIALRVEALFETVRGG